MPSPMQAVKDLLGRLPMDEQEELHAYLGRILAPAQVERIPAAAAKGRKPRGVHVGTVRTREATVTYRAERVRCGKDGCACRQGKLHGPYVYKYWREDGRLRKSYVGKGGVGPSGAKP